MFKEHRLVFDVKPLSLVDPRKSPAEYNAEAVNPPQSIKEFEGEESTWANKAWGHPLKDAARENWEDIKDIGSATLYPVQAGLNTVKSITENTSSAISRLLSAYLINPVKIAGRTVAAPISFVMNNTQRALAAAVKYPASLVNIAGSHIGRPFLAISGWAKKGYEKVKSGGEAVSNKISGIQASIRDKTNSALNLPGMSAPQPQAA